MQSLCELLILLNLLRYQTGTSCPLMSEHLKEATTLIEHGHVRVGPNVVTDPAFLVTRTFEDYVTWVDSSKIKRTVMKYNDKLDDFDLLGN
jgi:U3 small nucleolar ribonucleoprotein protein IMP3